jgi:hypothetical protein
MGVNPRANNEPSAPLNTRLAAPAGLEGDNDSNREEAPKSATDFSYTVNNVPSDLEENPRGVYGYVPKLGTQFAPPKWSVDWTDRQQVAKARAVRLEYHQNLENEKKLIADMRVQGKSAEEIGRFMNDLRNNTRMNFYKTEEGRQKLRARNMEKYGNEMGPTYEQSYKQFRSAEGVIAATTRPNVSMDILTGVAKVNKRANYE